MSFAAELATPGVTGIRMDTLPRLMYKDVMYRTIYSRPTMNF